MIYPFLFLLLCLFLHLIFRFYFISSSSALVSAGHLLSSVIFDWFGFKYVSPRDAQNRSRRSLISLKRWPNPFCKYNPNSRGCGSVAPTRPRPLTEPRRASSIFTATARKASPHSSAWRNKPCGASWSMNILVPTLTSAPPATTILSQAAGAGAGDSDSE